MLLRDKAVSITASQSRKLEGVLLAFKTDLIFKMYSCQAVQLFYIKKKKEANVWKRKNMNIKCSESSAEEHLWQTIETELQQDKKKKLVEHCRDICLQKNYRKCIKLTEPVLPN